MAFLKLHNGVFVIHRQQTNIITPLPLPYPPGYIFTNYNLNLQFIIIAIILPFTINIWNE